MSHTPTPVHPNSFQDIQDAQLVPEELAIHLNVDTAHVVGNEVLRKQEPRK